ncbi:MAG: hypothetical protein ACP5PV_12650 [Methanothrix sp.]
MIIIEKRYKYKFQREIIESAYKSFKDIIKENALNNAEFRIGFENKTLTFDNEEDFYSHYRKDLKMAKLSYYFKNSYHFNLYYYDEHKSTEVELALPTEDDTDKELSFFEEDCKTNLLDNKDKLIDKTNSKVNCSLSKQLPSCFINKNLIYDL